MTEPAPATQEMGHILRDWNARQYLDYYYGQRVVPDDEVVMFQFIARGLREVGRRFESGLDLGCGPVLHHAAQAVRWVDRLDMADVHRPNLEEIERWIRNDPGAFDWSVYIGATGGALDAEGGDGGTLAEREAIMRSRIRVRPCDLLDEQPLGAAVQYPLVTSYYCAEWVIPTMDGWRDTMRRVTSLVAPGGWLFLAGVHDTSYCLISGRPARCARVTHGDVRGALGELGFVDSTIRIDVTPGLRPEVTGIQGTFMAYAQRA
jgi:phenylethanolamine N-methyltransferase